MEYRILGPLEVHRRGHALRLGGVRQRSVLALLLLRPNQVVATEQLIDALWEDSPPPTARQSLQNSVAALRRAIGAGALLTRHPGYLLRVEPGERDLDRFRHLVSEARGAQQSAPAVAADLLRAALALWRGSPLADLAASGVTWARRADLEQERLSALELRIEADLALGRHDEVVGELEELVRAYPLRERLRGHHMLALYRSGRQADALAAYGRARETFVGELGIEPDTQLRTCTVRSSRRRRPSRRPAGSRPPRRGSSGGW